MRATKRKSSLSSRQTQVSGAQRQQVCLGKSGCKDGLDARSTFMSYTRSAEVYVHALLPVSPRQRKKTMYDSSRQCRSQDTIAYAPQAPRLPG
eukprot:1158801-Pelagomonas_calceolata.AAC.5